jgi:hypothetical protein
MKTHDTFTLDPEDSAALRRWTEERAAKLQELRVAQARAAWLADQLTHDPAASALAELDAAGSALTQAQAAATTAQRRADDAAAAAERFAAVEVADAQTALDRATQDLSKGLAALLAEASTSTMLTATVDGLALRERYRTGTAGVPPGWNHLTIPFPTSDADVVDPELRLPAVDPAADSEYLRLLAVLDRLDERVDAVADLLTAESVHHLVQGNPTRAGASLATVAEGRVPDELEVIRTPRLGQDVTHRVMVVLDPRSRPAWAAPQPGLAALLDPLAAAWGSRLLPDPAAVVVQVRRVEEATGEAGEPLELSMDKLGLDPLAWVRMAANTPELHQRIAAAARDRWRTTPGAAGGRVEISDQPGATGAGLRLSDLLAAADALGRLLTAGRALAAEDLVHPAAPDPAPPRGDVVEAVAERVRQAERSLVELVTALEQAAAATTPDPAALTGLLLAAAALGVAEAVPPAGEPDGSDPGLLRTLAAAAAGRLRARSAAAAFAADPADPAGTLTRARARAEQLCGMRLPLLVEVAVPLDATARADLEGNGPSRLAGAAPATVRAWLGDHARVRPAVRQLTAAYDLAETLTDHATLDLRVTQLPVADPDTWAGATASPRAGAVDVVVQRGYADRLPAAVAGLVADAWNQPVAAPMHQTALAFHYDQPDATPPQAVLVAVHPDPRPDRPAATWDLDILLDILTSTLALARDRATAAERRRTAGLDLEDTP